jgi:hypothetical protein
MPTLDFTKLERLHWLIARGWAGPPATLAVRLGVAPRTLYRYVRALRRLGAPVAFCRRTGRYGYTADWGYSHPPEKIKKNQQKKPR